MFIHVHACMHAYGGSYFVGVSVFAYHDIRNIEKNKFKVAENIVIKIFQVHNSIWVRKNANAKFLWHQSKSNSILKYANLSKTVWIYYFVCLKRVTDLSVHLKTFGESLQWRSRTHTYTIDRNIAKTDLETLKTSDVCQ